MWLSSAAVWRFCRAHRRSADIWWSFHRIICPAMSEPRSKIRNQSAMNAWTSPNRMSRSCLWSIPKSRAKLNESFQLNWKSVLCQIRWNVLLKNVKFKILKILYFLPFCEPVETTEPSTAQNHVSYNQYFTMLFISVFESGKNAHFGFFERLLWCLYLWLRCIGCWFCGHICIRFLRRLIVISVKKPHVVSSQLWNIYERFFVQYKCGSSSCICDCWS